MMMIQHSAVTIKNWHYLSFRFHSLPTPCRVPVAYLRSSVNLR